MLWRDLVCVCLLTVAIHSVVEGSSTRDVSKKHENEVSFKDLQSVETGVWSQGKPKRLFARRGLPHRQKPSALHRVAKPKQSKHPKQQPAVPVRRCPRVMESCVPNMPCCDPCATCHCRFFNIICHCWRLGRHCPKKT
ncbi:agouti-signaling protein 2b [Megalops cyprinoides]|uniref:agouti-signaling protein 2b n=1 Tax=Megalops cyprinoides TaxID=118141 RepID=UPI001863DACC|nr:agouti-signaling protein 2b [Megalops cyprinoides]